MSRDGSLTAGSGAACNTSACSGMTSRLFKAMMSSLRQCPTSATPSSPPTKINVGPHLGNSFSIGQHYNDRVNLIHTSLPYAQTIYHNQSNKKSNSDKYKTRNMKNSTDINSAKRIQSCPLHFKQKLSIQVYNSFYLLYKILGLGRPYLHYCP